ncbi:MAG: peptidoglycan-binding protein, partial [Coleofasciculus sp. S288]|nr:peptidoglycan-binding protein [Coleofasciculus sp. S288]
MEPLDYLYLALVKVAPASKDGTVSETIGESSRPFAWLKPSHLSTTANLLAVTVALGVLGMARQASALIQHGDRGTEVTALQERLKELGYFKANATGYYGGITKAAVRQFQQERGLTPDGIVGTQTQAALEEQQEEEQAEESSS